MKIQTNEIRIGNILENNGKRCIVLKTTTFKAGKGGAYIQVEMRDLKTGNKVKSEEIFSLSLNGDIDAIKVIDMFTIAFARTLSDLSLAFSSGGGIILAGSLSRSFLTIANKDLFNKHFLDGKSDIHKEILNKVGVKVANRGYTCLFGSLNYINSI